MKRPAQTLLVLLGLALTTSLSAQTFQRMVGGVFEDEPTCIEHTVDDGYIISGTQSEIVYT